MTPEEHRRNGKDGIPPEEFEEMAQEVVDLISIIIIVSSLVLIALNGFLLYLCLKKRSERQKMKDRMTELQVAMAAQQGMSLF